MSESIEYDDVVFVFYLKRSYFFNPLLAVCIQQVFIKSFWQLSYPCKRCVMKKREKKNVTSSAKYVFPSCKRNNLTQRLNTHVQYIYYKYVFLLLQKNRNLTHPHNTVKVKNTRNVRGRKEETMVYDER